MSTTAKVFLFLIGLALVAILVSNKANTGSVLGAGGKSFSNALSCALSPVTGGSCGSGSLLTPHVTSSVSFGNEI